jgi:hypothetical protein
LCSKFLHQPRLYILDHRVECLYSLFVEFEEGCRGGGGGGWVVVEVIFVEGWGGLRGEDFATCFEEFFGGGED